IVCRAMWRSVSGTGRRRAARERRAKSSSAGRRTVVITVTETAAAKVKQLVEAEGNLELALRVAVRPGGCSGLSYEMFFDSEFNTDDEKAEFGGIKVVVDSASAQYLAGASLDYKEGLM